MAPISTGGMPCARPASRESQKTFVRGYVSVKQHHMAANASRRLLRELKTLQAEPSDEISLNCIDDDVFQWVAQIRGPPDTPYEGAYFKLEIVVPSSYPLQPPAVKFLTKIFHPNVHFKVCVTSVM
jgi:ubiquitin-protein ligase